MKEFQISECTRRNLCVDCDNIHCAFMGKALADCPKYNCDMGGDLFQDCDRCSFMKTYQKDMRKMYAEEIQN